MIHLFLPCTLPRWSTGHLSSLHAFCGAVPWPLPVLLPCAHTACLSGPIMPAYTGAPLLGSP